MKSAVAKKPSDALTMRDASATPSHHRPKARHRVCRPRRNAKRTPSTIVPHVAFTIEVAVDRGPALRVTQALGHFDEASLYAPEGAVRWKMAVFVAIACDGAHENFNTVVDGVDGVEVKRSVAERRENRSVEHELGKVRARKHDALGTGEAA